jgi:riboflavin kinase/FMN adenylyltransferase
MRIYRSLDAVPADFGPCALTIGNFDGVHLGHRRIVRRLVSLAAGRGWRPAVLTFDPHPTRIVAPERTPPLLTSPVRRAELMGEEGVEQALILPFDSAVARLTPDEFARAVLAERLKARAVLVGDNFHFGFHQAGDVRVLAELGRKYGFDIEIVPPAACRGRRVSSSGIRELVRAGCVSLAARFLGRPYALEGKVVPGRGVGSKLTVPTLNLASSAEVIPSRGVYATRTFDTDGNRVWNSITNVGARPTFEDGGELSIETFLLDPLGDGAPRQIRVEFLWRVRDERKFESPAALKARILQDARAAGRYFRRVKAWTAAAEPI